MREYLKELNSDYLYFDDDMVFNMTLEKMMGIDEAIALELRNNNPALTNKDIAALINKKRLSIST
ncbi:hypothetical protein [Clostridium perfringens]|uniref:hypothetical protein n=1 Tax=Clostridium perfringens TaxID=1502 RepID=UPI0024BD5784|nr:hypothetical protein [Clostridium perfringens]